MGGGGGGGREKYCLRNTICLSVCMSVCLSVSLSLSPPSLSRPPPSPLPPFISTELDWTNTSTYHCSIALFFSFFLFLFFFNFMSLFLFNRQSHSLSLPLPQTASSRPSQKVLTETVATITILSRTVHLSPAPCPITWDERWGPGGGWEGGRHEAGGEGRGRTRGSS